MYTEDSLFLSNQIFVAPDGRDSASGQKDAPLQTLEAALRLVKQLSETDWRGPMTIELRGGVYPLKKTLDISLTAPVTIRSYENEQAIFDGGEPIEGLSETELHGRRCWVAALPEGRYFHSLFVDGVRRPRAALPKNGFYRIESVPGQTLNLPYNVSSDRFIVKEGDFFPTRNLNDVLAHVFHYWSDEQMPVKSFDPETRLLVSSIGSCYTLHEDTKKDYARYRLENVFEGLTEPGDWYLDRAARTLYYLPCDGETLENTALTAPVCERAFLFRNCADITVENITVRHFDWHIGEEKIGGQGVCTLPGVVSFDHCTRCALKNSRIEHVGYYCVDIQNSASLLIAGNTLRDMGAGGVKINGATASEPREERTHHITVCNNLICEGGRQFLAGIGVLSMHANHVRIAHNEIHDLYYTGVSCGWVWGYAESASFDNVIEYNHIYDIGHFVLSDMGGIYTLGVQPGTVIRYNLIHDIEKANYGGWAIYPDEGSSHMLIENNIGYRTTSTCFHQHYGRENIVRNNIFALGGEGAVHWTRKEPHVSFTFEHNILLVDNQPLFTGPDRGNLKCDMNLYWDVGGRPLVYAPDRLDASTRQPYEVLREKGYDRFSVIADPRFRDPAHGDFTLEPGSPAESVGFVPIDMTGVGIRSGRS